MHKESDEIYILIKQRNVHFVSIDEIIKTLSLIRPLVKFHSTSLIVKKFKFRALFLRGAFNLSYFAAIAISV